MRLRYIQLKKYPPIQDLAVRFASGSPLNRTCAIRFVVGVNGSGKSNLLRAVAEVFLALADMRLPPFPVTLIYELGIEGSSSHRTLLLDCPGKRGESSLWLHERFRFDDSNGPEVFAFAIEHLRAKGMPSVPGFVPLIQPGDWPTRAVNPPQIALPHAVLAYTTGDLTPWRSIWNRNQAKDGLIESENEQGDEGNIERPAGWSAAQEIALALPSSETSSEAFPSGDEAISPMDSDLYRRPLLLNPVLLKCALLAVALPQAFIETHDYPGREEVDAAMAEFRGRADNKNPLQELLERGGWHHLVSVTFRCRLQTKAWNRTLLETAHDWLLCSTDVIAEPHPREARRLLLFDLKQPFSSQGVDTLIANDELDISTTHGEALWSLLGGSRDVPPFELFTNLVKLHQAGLFDDLELRLRRADKPEPDAGLEAKERDIGVLRYEELSDGEQMVLGRMALFHLLEGQEDALLLLDEPETHFNDKWKREIVDIIDEAIGRTANDVLISTHSAIVLSDVFNDEIVLLERKAEDGSTQCIDLVSPTFGGEPGEIMIRLFGAEASFGKRSQQWLIAETKRLRNTQGARAEIEALIEQIGPGVPRARLRAMLYRLDDPPAGSSFTPLPPLTPSGRGGTLFDIQFKDFDSIESPRTLSQWEVGDASSD